MEPDMSRIATSVIQSINDVSETVSLCLSCDEPPCGKLPYNIAEAVEHLAASSQHIADAITPAGAPGTDAAGTSVWSLTEAVMGITAGLCEIASAINNLAESVREHHDAGT